VKKLYQTIVNIGINENDSLESQYKIHAMNVFCFFTFFIAIFYGIIFYLIDWIGPFYIFVCYNILNVAILFLNYKRSFLTAKFILVVMTAISVLVITIMMGFESGFHLYLLSSPLFIFWLYDIVDYKSIFMSFFIYLLVFFFIFFFKDYYVPTYQINFNFYGIPVDIYSLNLFINLLFLFVLFYNYSDYYRILMERLMSKQRDLKVEIEKRINSEEHTRKIFLDLTQSYNRVNQFNYIVSHNLKAPLSNIKGFLNLYDKNLIDESQRRELIQYISSATKNLDEVITDLNSVIQSNNQLLDKKENVILSELIAEIKNTEIHIIETYDRNFSLNTVRTLLHSVLINIIQNSIKYKNDQVTPYIFIDVIHNTDQLIIKIADNGIGIDLQRHGDKIFSLYSRFHANVKQGKGMGLYLVKSHMEMMGGTIHIESKPNEGTTLFLRFDRD